MAENSYDDLPGESGEPSVFQAKVAILLGPDERKNIIAERMVAGEMISRDGGDAKPHVAISDTIDLLTEALISIGEDICDQINARYSDGMPDFLGEFANMLSHIQYGKEDDARQASNRGAMNLPPID